MLLPLSDFLLVLRTPPYSTVFLAALSLAINVITMLVNRKLVDQEKLREYMAKVREFDQLRLQAMRERDPKVKKKLEAQIRRKERVIAPMKSELLKMQFMPTAFLMVPMIVIFYLLRGLYLEIPIVVLPFPLPLQGLFHRGSVMSQWELGYIGFYMIFSLTASVILNKLLGMQPEV
ncbi:MAG: hypothetical protein DRN96_01055 [Thermoproteota archaeon]|nr:MAG: hypothetical protein DRN96_01055 [Candidatus Korarchaeota archaeon]RLG54515.1 MAG: hypothetical protein DRN99_05010 [Candidatus Korarchaeota archaeon]